MSNRVRRTRAVVADTPAPRQVRRTPAHLLEQVVGAGREDDLTATGEVEVFHLTVELEVVAGSVSANDFKVWMQEAVNQYHRFRGGYMDPVLHGLAKCPIVRVSGENL